MPYEVCRPNEVNNAGVFIMLESKLDIGIRNDEYNQPTGNSLLSDSTVVAEHGVHPALTP